MKKLFILFGLFLTANVCIAQPSIDDLNLEIDLMVDYLPSQRPGIWDDFRLNIDHMFSNLSPIKRNNMPIILDPTTGYADNCHCGYKWVTQYVDFPNPIYITDNSAPGSPILIGEQHEFAKQFLAQVMLYLNVSGININNVKELHMLYTNMPQGGPHMNAYGFHFTYRVCMPCPN